MTNAAGREVVLYEARLEPIRAGQPLTHIEGRAVPYNIWTNRGWFLESVDFGSLDKSIQESAAGLPLLLFHDDRAFPVGVSEDWDSKKDGLYGIWRLDEGEQAQRAAQLARDGFLRYFSVGISPIRSSWDYVGDSDWDPAKGPDHMDRCLRTEARLLETSLVTTPAFASAQVKLVHSDTSAPPGRPNRRPSLAAWRAELARIQTPPA